MESFEYYANMCEDVIAYYVRHYSYLGSESGKDIRQEALMAIDHARRLYDENQGSFKSYASNWIRSYVYDYINKVSRVVSISREANRKIKAVRECMEKNPHASLDDLAKLLDMSRDSILRYQYGIAKVELDREISSDNDDTLLDTLADDSYLEARKREGISYMLDRIRSTLSDEDRSLLFNSFGVDGEKLSQEELARRLGISHQAVSKRIKGIIKRLQSELATDCSLYLLMGEIETNLVS